MLKNEDIEIYLDRCDFPYERIQDGIWQVDVPEDRVEGIVLSHLPPLVMIEIRLMQVPPDADASFFRGLLEANVSTITHGAFGIQDDYVILLDTLQSEHLDLNELKASIQSLSFTVVQYYKDFVHSAS